MKSNLIKRNQQMTQYITRTSPYTKHNQSQTNKVRIQFLNATIEQLLMINCVTHSNISSCFCSQSTASVPLLNVPSAFSLKIPFQYTLIHHAAASSLSLKYFLFDQPYQTTFSMDLIPLVEDMLRS